MTTKQAPPVPTAPRVYLHPKHYDDLKATGQLPPNATKTGFRPIEFERVPNPCHDHSTWLKMP